MPSEELIKNCYALAYAGFRLGGSLDNPAMRQSLEDQSLSILTVSLGNDLAGLRHALRRLEYMVGFGRDIGIIPLQGAEVLLYELEAFKNSLPQSSKTDLPKEITKEDLFPEGHRKPSDAYRKDISSIWMEESGGADDRHNQANDNSAIAELAHGPAIIPQSNSQGEEGFTIRKSKILQKVRQSGNCRMRDIQEILADTSERTLRYDLQRLVQEGLIERIGNGGPGTYYRALL